MGNRQSYDKAGGSHLHSFFPLVSRVSGARLLEGGLALALTDSNQSSRPRDQRACVSLMSTSEHFSLSILD